MLRKLTDTRGPTVAVGARLQMSAGQRNRWCGQGSFVRVLDAEHTITQGARRRSFNF